MSKEDLTATRASASKQKKTAAFTQKTPEFKFLERVFESGDITHLTNHQTSVAGMAHLTNSQHLNSDCNSTS